MRLRFSGGRLQGGPRQWWVRLPRFGNGMRWQRQPSVAQQDVQSALGEQLSNGAGLSLLFTAANDRHQWCNEHVLVAEWQILLLSLELACAQSCIASRTEWYRG